MPTIQDPVSSDAARVVNDRLYVDTRTPFQRAVEDGRAFVVTSTVTPTGAADNFCDIKHIASSPYSGLVIEGIRARCASADTITMIHGPVVSTSADGPTTITPAPLSSTPISLTGVATAEDDPDLATLATALPNEIGSLRLAAANTDYTTSPRCRISRDSMFALRATTGTAAMDVDIIFYVE